MTSRAAPQCAGLSLEVRGSLGRAAVFEDLGRVGPDHLPAPVSPLVVVGMPVAAQVDVTTCDDDLEVRVVTEATGISNDAHLDVQRLPDAVVDNAGRNVSEVLLLTEAVAARRDQLKVVGVNGPRYRDVRFDKARKRSCSIWMSSACSEANDTTLETVTSAVDTAASCHRGTVSRR